jgi:hypothetical protein
MEQRVGRYSIRGTLGRGASGTVYLGLQPELAAEPMSDNYDASRE